MLIPKRLYKLLSKDKTLEAKVHLTLEGFEPWIAAGGQRPTFFPDYTDHSLRHIEEVLATAEDLVRPEAWKALSPADAAVFVISTVLHDSALHLTKEGFESLVRPQARWGRLPYFGDRPWSELWVEFCAESKRFDTKRLVDIFGDALPAPTLDLDNLVLDARSRRLIGEFLRRHHPRLAHEIGVSGVPGATATIQVYLSREYADIAGLVARSHGASIRTFLPYLKSVYHNRVAPLGIHAVFLMVLLRVADYLQIQASRAPSVLKAVHRIRSPYSSTEWNLHSSIRDIRESDDDPETIFIRATPDDVKTYLRLTEWLRSLQSEVDHSWAVLGEVYGRQENALRRLGIRLRRIASNVDNETTFSESLSYVPQHVTFTTSGPELLKLLIGPLYGDRPEIGVRELVQNAVDAVRELRLLQANGTVSRHASQTDLQADVEVVLEVADDKTILTVSDQGAGMTAEMVVRYFLRAGASFRSSDEWAQLFQHESHSQVLRSGRFGVGALAAFLIGDTIEVTSRHFSVEPNRGIKFKASLESDPIELEWYERPVGTTIRITVSADAASKLLHGNRWFDLGDRKDSWDWYCLASPTVIRRLVPGPSKLRQRYKVPAAGEPLFPGWRRIEVPRLLDVTWTYGPAPALSCNGIIVKRNVSPFGERDPIESAAFYSRKSDVLLPGANPFPFRPPAVAVHDPDAILPLDLQRKSLTFVPQSLATALLRDVYNDYLHYAIKTVPATPFFETGDAGWNFGVQYPGSSSSTRPQAIWYWTHAGYVVSDAYALWTIDAVRFVFYPVMRDADSAPALTAEICNEPGIVAVPVPLTLDDVDLYRGEESAFGDGAQTHAYREFMNIVFSRLAGDEVSADWAWPPFMAAVARAYDWLGVAAYAPQDACSEMKRFFDELAEDTPAMFDDDANKTTGIVSVALSLPTMKAQLTPSFKFVEGTPAFPIIEIGVRRKSNAVFKGLIFEEIEANFPAAALLRRVG